MLIITIRIFITYFPMNKGQVITCSQSVNSDDPLQSSNRRRIETSSDRKSIAQILDRIISRTILGIAAENNNMSYYVRKPASSHMQQKKKGSAQLKHLQNMISTFSDHILTYQPKPIQHKKGSDQTAQVWRLNVAFC